jgi:type IV secretory pathway VirB3-like protein
MGYVTNIAAIWNLVMVLVVAVTLCGFVYFLVVRRLWRIRQIAAAKERRMLREAAERGQSQ